MVLEHVRFGRIGVCLAVALTSLAVGACIESEDPMDPGTLNEAPEAVGIVPPVAVSAGDHVMVDVSGFFQDPDDDPLLYGAGTSNALVAGVSVAGNVMTVVGVGTGEAAGFLFARDPSGAEAVQNFVITVPNEPPIVAQALPALRLTTGQVNQIDLSQYFEDPEGGDLAFGVTTANALVAVAAVASGSSTLTVVGVTAGVTTMTVTARDADGGEAQQETTVVVTGG